MPENFHLEYHDIFLETTDGTRLHGWFLPSRIDKKGTVFFLHGNAQNISAHINSIYWLPKEGYNVFLLDYRGYGKSTGAPSLNGVLKDIKVGFEWLEIQPSVKNAPIYILGQSIGASLCCLFYDENPIIKNRISGIILDSGFSNLRMLVREKLSGFRFTWPFRYPLSLIFSSKFNPEKTINKISPVPLMIMHSDEDRVIPSSHSKKLFKLAGHPKYFVKTSGSHILTFKFKENQIEMLEFMTRFSKKK
ncbi:MAG: alpha/beta hydrolase [Deltaproteobacteria bacterium]|nr:alpha/beta hydrolase [Deltaproteobacteria bacterium]